MTSSRSGSIGSILLRLFEPHLSELNPTVARFLLEIGFDETAARRVHDLSAKARAGKLSTAEAEELDRYISIADFLTILHARVHFALRQGETAAQ